MAYKSFTDGGSTTDTSTTQEVDLGSLQTVDGEAGPVTWIYVYNDDGSHDWFEGCVVVREAPGSATHAAGKGMAYDGIRSASTTYRNKVLGVAQGVIKQGEYGWIVAKGVCTVKGDDALAAGDDIINDADGTVDTATSTETNNSKGIGYALNDSAATTFLTTCLIDVL